MSILIGKSIYTMVIGGIWWCLVVDPMKKNGFDKLTIVGDLDWTCFLKIYLMNPNFWSIFVLLHSQVNVFSSHRQWHKLKQSHRLTDEATQYTMDDDSIDTEDLKSYAISLGISRAKLMKRRPAIIARIKQTCLTNRRISLCKSKNVWFLVYYCNYLLLCVSFAMYL